MKAADSYTFLSNLGDPSLSKISPKKSFYVRAITYTRPNDRHKMIILCFGSYF